MDTMGPSNDTCGCCKGREEPAAPENGPGLAAIGYRVDTQPGFAGRMLESLPLAPADPDSPESPRPLARLLTRASDDPTVALVDAAACVADVLTFYQQRIANEGFLRTATERRSVLELARAIGYELKPGVAASTHLVFTVEDAPGAPGECRIAKGSPVQSVPPQGKLPQVFETGAELLARAEWNALVPRQSRPADMALVDVAADGGSRTALALLGPVGSIPAGTPGLQPGLDSATLFRLDPALAVDATVDALEVGRIYVAETVTGIAGGDLMLFVGKRGAELKTLVLRVTGVAPEPELARLRIDLEPLPAPEASAPPPLATWIVPYALRPIPLTLARPQVTPVPFVAAAITSTVAGQPWRESDLQAMIGIQRWNAVDLVAAITARPASGPPLAPEAGPFAFDAKLGFFGNNAPKWQVLPPHTANTHGDAYPAGWDAGDGNGQSPAGKLTAPRTVWQDSQGNSISPRVYLDRAVPNVNRASWAVFDAPDVAARAFSVVDAREVSRADFGISGRALQVRLADETGTSPPQTLGDFSFRSSSAHVASRRLDLTALPIDAPIAAGDTAIELDRMVLGLAVGQPVALRGDRADLPGVAAAEIAELADIVHRDGRTTLLLKHELANTYRRTSLRISANVVAATHGETTTELLGNGDAAVPGQRFTLKKPPTTFVSAVGGVASTLEVRVGGVLWDERPSLYGAGPDEPVYTTRLADDAAMTVIFGDGVRGARLPSGSLNVAARYRSGIGPDGEVAADTLTMLRAMPLGLRGVTNPLPATGAEGPERLADARANAPLTLLTFERVVSLLDYESYARAFPGIGKARGDELWIHGASRVFVTVAGATGGPPGDDVLANLVASIAGASDPSQRFEVAAFAQRYFRLTAKVAVDPRYLADEVLAAVSAALLAGFGFEARGLGQSVTAAEVIALVHTVPGVIAVDLDALEPYADTPQPADAPAAAVPAFGARRAPAGGAILPAELVQISPAGIDLKEMPT